jgi:uncharacterized membrane protein
MTQENANARLEAFCDGVFAIALTLLIIDIKIPPSATVSTPSDFWIAIRHIAPSILAFILSFIVILITWVNHHAFLKLVNRSSPSFMFANGFLLLTVVFIPFPTSLMGEYLLTGAAGPAVALYDGILAVQGVAWVLLGNLALSCNLTRNEKSTLTITTNRKHGYEAIIGYSLLALCAFWLPTAVALLTACTWMLWLVLGIRITPE